MRANMPPPLSEPDYLREGPRGVSSTGPVAESRKKKVERRERVRVREEKGKGKAKEKETPVTPMEILKRPVTAVVERRELLARWNQAEFRKEEETVYVEATHPANVPKGETAQERVIRGIQALQHWMENG